MKFDQGIAAAALGRLRAHEAADDLLAAVEKGSYWTQLGAIGALADLGDTRVARPAVEAIGRNDFRPQEGNDWELLDMLTDEIGELDFPETVEALGRALQDPSWVVRYGAVAALAKLGRQEAEPLIKAALDDDEPEVRREAAVALAVLAGDEDARQL